MNNLEHSIKLSSLCEVVTKGTTPTSVGHSFTPEGEVNFIKIESLSLEGKIIKTKVAAISEECNKALFRSQLKENDILFSIAGALGRVGIVGKEILPANTNQALAIIRLKDKNDITIRFLQYYFKSLSILQQINGFKGGVAQQNLSLTQIKEFVIPQMKISEQEAIVEKLDFAFDAIEKAKANIEKNIENAKEVFQSKLNEMFSIEYIKNAKVKTLKEITTILGDGLHGTPKYDVEGKYHFINGNNLTNEHIVFKESTKKVNEEEFNKYKKNLSNRTILVSINGTLGNVAFYNDEKVILGKSACYFNIAEGIDKRYIMYQFKNPKFIKYAHKEATGATIKNVSLKSMRNFNIVLPETLQEQEKIVFQLDNLSLQTSLLQVKYKHKLANLEELKKSILEKAFKGELV